jgi:hypothetical protein
MWFLALACIAIGIGLKTEPSNGFIFFGVTSLFSLFLYTAFQAS